MDSHIFKSTFWKVFYFKIRFVKHFQGGHVISNIKKKGPIKLAVLMFIVTNKQVLMFIGYKQASQIYVILSYQGASRPYSFFQILIVA